MDLVAQCSEDPEQLAIKNKHREAADLLTAAMEGLGSELVQILEADPELIRVVDPVGDTTLHLLVRGGHIEALRQLIEFLQDRHPELLKAVKTQRDRHWNTPVELAIENKHREAASLLAGNSPTQSRFRPCSLTVDLEMAIRGMPFDDKDIGNLIQFKNKIGNTVFHGAASSGKTDMLANIFGQLDETTKIISYNNIVHLPTLKKLLMEGNKNGNTALHLALMRREMKTALYLMVVQPEAAYKINNKGISPLYLAFVGKHYDLVKYVLRVMPEASISLTIRHTLCAAAKKASLPHAVIRSRNLSMLKLLLESLPSLIDSMDDLEWKPLPYAAYKGYVEEVQYLLKRFPESVKKVESDGTLPIHKAVSGGHVSIFKEFISSHPQTLYDVDDKGRSILHIAVRYAKTDILTYLTGGEINEIKEILHFKDHAGKTFMDLAKELK